MKLNKLIENLEKAILRYKKEFGIDNPEVYSIDEEDGMLICASITEKDGLITAKKPYMHVRTGLENII